MVTILIFALAAAVGGNSGSEPSPVPCGLEEVSDPSLKVCPPHVTYDEEGEEVGGEQQAEAEND